MPDEGDLVFKGTEVSLKLINGEYRIPVTQKAFVNKLQKGKQRRGRISETIKLSSDELRKYHSCAGSLQWLAGCTRPDIAATVSLNSLGTDNGPTQLKAMYDCVDYVKDSAEDGLVFRGVALNYGMVIVGYSDSSWANAPGGKNQMGVIVAVTSPECQEVTTKATLEKPKTS